MKWSMLVFLFGVLCYTGTHAWGPGFRGCIPPPRWRPSPRPTPSPVTPSWKGESSGPVEPSPRPTPPPVIPSWKGESSGPAGPPGFPGRPGFPGLPGLIGQKGEPGRYGKDGRPGYPGPKGELGHVLVLTQGRSFAVQRGNKGDESHGLHGRPGKDGPVGKDGRQGEKGDRGIGSNVVEIMPFLSPVHLAGQELGTLIYDDSTDALYIRVMDGYKRLAVSEDLPLVETTESPEETSGSGSIPTEMYLNKSF